MFKKRFVILLQFTSLLILVLLFLILLSGCNMLFHEHNYTESIIAPACETNGYTLYYCACGDSYKENIVPAKGHVLADDIAVEATCTQTGLSSGTHCIVCGKVIQAQSIVPQLVHQDEDHDGYCSVCNTHFEEVIDINNVEELKGINNNLNGIYRLKSDLSLVDIDWIALGSSSEHFTGKLYGMGFTISGLSLFNKSVGGLIAYNSGVIDGVVLSDISISIENMNGTLGGLAAYNDGIIVNCQIEGDFTINNTISHYEERRYPSYNGTTVSYTGVFGGVCAVNTGTVSNCEISSKFLCEFSNTNNYQLSVAIFYLECGHSSTSNSTVFFGGISGKNFGIIEDCNVIGSNVNTIHILAEYKNHGTSTARINAYIGSMIGLNDNIVSNCRATKSLFSKDLGATSLKESNGSSYGVVCDLNLYEDSIYSGIIGRNDGNATNVLYY